VLENDKIFDLVDEKKIKMFDILQVLDSFYTFGKFF